MQDKLANCTILDRARSGLAFAACLAVAAGCLDAEPAENGKEPETSETDQEVVYGIDNRQDVFAHSDLSLRRLARFSTATMMLATSVDESNPSNITFTAPTLGADRNLCPGQRFAADPTAGECSVTLIDDDLVLTAGHCVEGDVAIACADMRIVFDYFRLSPTQMKTVTSADVFRCSQVVVSNLEAGGIDYGIIRLDRVATPRFTPAPVRQDRGQLVQGRRLGMIGSPSGIPLKIDSGAAVRDPRAASLDFFVANTDSFGGNSGSGVYDLETYAVAGILVRGVADYIAAGSCNVVNTCTETGCNGESITYVAQALDDLCSMTTNARLCTPRNVFSYSASNTNYATVNTTRHFVHLAPGQIFTAGTCGLNGASGTGDTFLRINGVDGTFQNASDDAPGCGSLSKVTITAPPLVGGVYEIQAGCSGSSSCTGNVAYTISGRQGGSGSFSTTGTASATINTVNFDVPLTAGQTLAFGTCGVQGATGSNDTYLRLYDPSGTQVAVTDDACGGVLSSATITVQQSGVFQIRAGCYANSPCSGTVAYTISTGGAVAYTASNTNYANQNTTNHNIALAAGQTLTMGTCGVAGSSGTGDTYLRLFDANGTQVAVSDDACGGFLSNLAFTAPQAGVYQVRAGCYSVFSCNGTIAYTLSRNDGGGSYAYTASNTASATVNTVDQPLFLEAGQALKLGTCGVPGSTGTGDTFVRLFGPNSEIVASNDDACGGLLSNTVFTVPAGGQGAYLIRGGCYSSTSCSGGLAFTVE